MSKIISVKNLIKRYQVAGDWQDILKDLNFDISAGEFVSIMGPSGSGKSTLLYQLGLLDHPNEGEIILAGANTTSMDSLSRTEFRLHNLGFVFQDYALIPDLTASENILVPLLMRGDSRAQAEKAALQALDQVGLADKAKNLPSQLSGGQQQRVSIARAIAHSPKILFADEPTASLDSEMSEQVMAVFQSLHRQGQTIVMVTHEPEYGQLADRIINLRDGRII